MSMGVDAGIAVFKQQLRLSGFHGVGIADEGEVAVCAANPKERAKPYAISGAMSFEVTNVKPLS